MNRKQKKHRETGYYWVQTAPNLWVIGHYMSSFDIWVIPGTDRKYYDSAFIEIRPLKITPIHTYRSVRVLAYASLVGIFLVVALIVYLLITTIIN